MAYVASGRAADDVVAGQGLFSKDWLPSDPRQNVAEGDGLGPVYNETSCLACHFQGGPGGSGPRGGNVLILTADAPPPARAPLLRLHPGLFSSQSIILHRFGVDPNYRVWRLTLMGDDLDAASIKADETMVLQMRGLFEAGEAWAGSGQVKDGLAITERNPQPLFGLGLLDSVPNDVLLAAEKRKFPNFPEVRGHTRRLADGQLGRFGWKAEAPTLREFVLWSCANELGLEVPSHHQASSPLAPNSRAPGLDMSNDECNALVSYVRSLAAPIGLNDDTHSNKVDVESGRILFQTTGCATCHQPQLGRIDGIYSDLLLHDMGPALQDAGRYYRLAEDNAFPRDAEAREWRTPPLWGYAESAPYLHHGLARNLDEAVAYHDGEALASARRFFKLQSNERLKMQMFLRTLRRSEPRLR